MESKHFDFAEAIKDSEFEKKWNKRIAAYNFTQVPNALLSCQKHLNLSDGELLTLVHLASFKFHPDSEIFPSISTLSKYGNKGYSTIQTRLRVLEEKGFVGRDHTSGTSNRYDLAPCVDVVSKHLKNCPSPPRNFKRLRLGNEVQPSSEMNSKEDYLIIPTIEKTAQVKRSTFTCRGLSS